MKTILLDVTGMHCQGCARTVEAVLCAEPGVRKASADFRTGRVRVLFDPAVTDGQRLAAAIRAVGYGVAGDSRS